jgi:hypothetical protein
VAESCGLQKYGRFGQNVEFLTASQLLHIDILIVVSLQNKMPVCTSCLHINLKIPVVYAYQNVREFL